ncbi:MAG TPA: TetR/AcrR family transcriptional regulator [Solirubrobacterales bacterium]|jgi:AcrR family transcriptional regulator|nr:TetR/AcrR family transcriptional regulator [Solirubrobacterales bacterium]
MEIGSAPRRLPPAQRREQLIDAALTVAAREGHERLAFEAVANQAGVTRNLVYHYFPGGRQELVEAAVHRAGEVLSSGWVTDLDVPLPERLAANLNRMMDHAEEPTDAWLLYRQSRGIVDPRLLEIAARYRERVISMIALNQLGNSKPPPIVHTAIDGLLAYVETVIETALAEGVDRERVVAVVAPALTATIDAAVSAAAESRAGDSTA